MGSRVKEDDIVSAPEGVEIQQTAHMYQGQQRMVLDRVSSSATWLTTDQKARNELLQAPVLRGFRFLRYSP